MSCAEIYLHHHCSNRCRYLNHYVHGQDSLDVPGIGMARRCELDRRLHWYFQRVVALVPYPSIFCRSILGILEICGRPTATMMVASSGYVLSIKVRTQPHSFQLYYAASSFGSQDVCQKPIASRLLFCPMHCLVCYLLSDFDDWCSWFVFSRVISSLC